MHVLACDQPEILADTSPFCRFAENNICEVLADYLGPRLALTSWVVGELEHRAKKAEHRQLEQLARREPPWTPSPVVDLGEGELIRAEALAQGWRRHQERQSGASRDERANLGEAATIVAAITRTSAVLLDEGKPKRYAINKGLTVITTEDLVVELVAVEALKQRQGFLIYQRVYKGSQASFDAALEAATAAIAARPSDS